MYDVPFLQKFALVSYATWRKSSRCSFLGGSPTAATSVSGE